MLDTSTPSFFFDTNAKATLQAKTNLVEISKSSYKEDRMNSHTFWKSLETGEGSFFEGTRKQKKSAHISHVKRSGWPNTSHPQLIQGKNVNFSSIIRATIYAPRVMIGANSTMP